MEWLKVVVRQKESNEVVRLRVQEWRRRRREKQEETLHRWLVEWLNAHRFYVDRQTIIQRRALEPERPAVPRHLRFEELF